MQVQFFLINKLFDYYTITLKYCRMNIFGNPADIVEKI